MSQLLQPPTKVPSFAATFATTPSSLRPPPPPPPVMSPPPPPSVRPLTTTPPKSIQDWLKQNWGKVLAIVLGLLITTIFVVRYILVARNKKKQREAENAIVQDEEWESFFREPRPMPSRAHPSPPPPPPHSFPPHSFPPHPPHPLPPPPQHQFQPPAPLKQVPVSPVLPPQSSTRGSIQPRFAPGENMHGGGLAQTIMPESTRPVRESADATFTINSEDIPIAPVKETEPAPSSSSAEQK